MQPEKMKQIFYHVVNYIPLFAFLLYARVYGLMQSTSADWQHAFYIGGGLAIFAIAFQLINNVLINRLWLAGHLFLMSNALLFTVNAQRPLAWVGEYKGATFILAFIAVGIVTTLFSSAGFIGAEHGNPTEIKKQSLLLLGACVLGFIWAYGTNAQSFWISTVLPIVLLRLLNKKLLANLFTLKNWT